MAKVLLVEDDPILGESLTLSLELAGHSISLAPSLAVARKHLEIAKYEIILLDLGLPDGFGLQLCKELKTQENSPPTIILTAQGDEETAVRCLREGAFDYVRKPFGHRELLARIQRALQTEDNDSEEIKINDLRISFDCRRVYFSDQELPLNRREFDIFSIFAKRMDRVVSRESLIDSLHHSTDINDRTIDSHISHIRRKIRKIGVEKLKIVSEYGVGYRMVLQ